MRSAGGAGAGVCCVGKAAAGPLDDVGGAAGGPENMSGSGAAAGGVVLLAEGPPSRSAAGAAAAAGFCRLDAFAAGAAEVDSKSAAGAGPGLRAGGAADVADELATEADGPFLGDAVARVDADGTKPNGS